MIIRLVGEHIMKAENQLQYMMDFQGDLFYTRQLCFDQLFCTVGNGYDWVNGELVENDGDTRYERWVLSKDIKHAEPDPNILATGLMKEEIVKTRLARNNKEPDLKWYPISEQYSYICNYPDDIKPDWLALIEECKNMLKEDGITVPKNRGFIYV